MLFFYIGRLIPGDVPVWTRTTDDRNNSGSLITAPAQSLQLSAGDTYAPSIMVTATRSGNFGVLSLQLGENCTIQGDIFNEKFCPIIHDQNISVTYNDDSTAVHTLYFNITIDDRFIDGQDNIIVYFHQEVDQMNHNISGYLYFEDSGCNPSTPIPRTDVVTTQCDCPMSVTGNSDATHVQTTIATCQKLLNSTSGSMLSSLYLPGSVFILVVSLLLSTP